MVSCLWKLRKHIKDGECGGDVGIRTGLSRDQLLWIDVYLYPLRYCSTTNKHHTQICQPDQVVLFFDLTPHYSMIVCMYSTQTDAKT
jgi:hypothetical protein